MDQKPSTVQKPLTSRRSSKNLLDKLSEGNVPQTDDEKAERVKFMLEEDDEELPEAADQNSSL
jgi:hypothetical protein